jgi:hypothetical protein
MKSIEQKIDEYIGAHFRFLKNYLNGGYEEYVRKNMQRITKRTVFGRKVMRSEYRHIKSPQILEQEVLLDCEKTLEYINSLK